MASKYAEGTVVPISRSRDELERTLQRFGSTSQAWMRDDERGRVVLAFRRSDRSYRFTVDLVGMAAYRRTPTGQQRTDKGAQDAADAENRRRFRSLANYVKAIMDAAATGIIAADQALLPYMMLPSGETVAEAVTAQLALGSGSVDLSRTLASGR